MPPPIRYAMESRQKMDMENMRLKVVGWPVTCCVENAYHVRPRKVFFERLSNEEGDSEIVDAAATPCARAQQRAAERCNGASCIQWPRAEVSGWHV